nr:ribonuclease H-like domain-containing protein [Tanacetum cinerariifolium]
MMAFMVVSLDQCNPLHLLPNDSNCASIVFVKLTGVDNYRFWASAVKLALQIKHKIGFITGTCVRSDYLASAPLLEQWDRYNDVVLNWILSSLSQDVYLGYVFSNNAAKDRVELVDHGKLLRLMQFLIGLDDVYQPIRSSILTREILPEVKDAFVIISREESHRGMSASSVKTKKPQASAFVSRSNDNNIKRTNTVNENWSNNNGNNENRGNYNSLLCKNYGLKGHTIDMCFEIIGYLPGFKRNPNLKPYESFNNIKTNFKNDVKPSAGIVSLNNDQVMKLMRLLNDKSGSSANAHMVGSCNAPLRKEDVMS